MSQKLQAFSISEAQLLDITMQQNVDLDDEVDDFSAAELGKMMIGALEEVLLAPRLQNVSENGFSMSFHYEDATKYYLYLCRKWGVTPDETIISGMSAIVDKTSIW